MLKDKKKSGTSTTEVVIGTSLAIAVLFIAMGLFNDNVTGMISNSNLSNIFNGNDSKTQYSAFNRDYSNSQINVQIMGDQGLDMTLRRTANNKAITQIGEILSGADTSTANINSIAYLTMAIKSIVGKPDVCVYMKKDSDKFCDEDEIGGYSYKIDLSGTNLTIKKVNTEGNEIITNKKFIIGNVLNSIFSSMVIPTDSSARSSLKKEEKYQLIKDISAKIKSYVYSHVILIREVNTFKTTRNVSIINDPDIMKGELANLYNVKISNFVYKDENNPAGISTNDFWGGINKDPNVAIDYVTSGQGKTDTLNEFSKLLTKVNTHASGNIHSALDNALGVKFVNDALNYAQQATYNKFVYDNNDEDSTNGVADLSSNRVAFFNNGQHNIANINERAKGKSRICFDYDFVKGPGYRKWGDNRDWNVLVVGYADPSQVITYYLNYFMKYCYQHSVNITY